MEVGGEKEKKEGWPAVVGGYRRGGLGFLVPSPQSCTDQHGSTMVYINQTAGTVQGPRKGSFQIMHFSLWKELLGGSTRFNKRHSGQGQPNGTGLEGKWDSCSIRIKRILGFLTEFPVFRTNGTQKFSFPLLPISGVRHPVFRSHGQNPGGSSPRLKKKRVCSGKHAQNDVRTTAQYIVPVSRKAQFGEISR